MTVILGEQSIGRVYFDDNQKFKNQINDSDINLIIKAYKHNHKMETLCSSIGARDFSPTELAAAHYYRTIKSTLELVLRLIADDVKDHDVEDFLQQLIHDSPPDISLILKEIKIKE
ncbi:hypothetical protein V1956_20280 [Yersinia sp. 2540 StPb PI]|uniref:hypothetical protein n=1 Tax=Yersinia sp. 2540 StPb PI TaxID=3117406 RepID=UPI003FA45469